MFKIALIAYCSCILLSGNITKKLPRRTVVPVSDTVIFCVELEKSCEASYWTRNGVKLLEDTRISIAHSMRQYTLTIHECTAEDSGEVAFVAGDCKTSTYFTVTGKATYKHRHLPVASCQEFPSKLLK